MRLNFLNIISFLIYCTARTITEGLSKNKPFMEKFLIFKSVLENKDEKTFEAVVHNSFVLRHVIMDAQYVYHWKIDRAKLPYNFVSSPSTFD